MVGALGTLGVITEISFKVLPMPVAEETLSFLLTAEKAIDQMNRWAGQPLPISATYHAQDRLWVRLSGAQSAVTAAVKKLSGQSVSNAKQFWQDVREHRAAFFSDTLPLWRLSVPSTSQRILISGEQAMEWNGAQRWLMSNEPADKIRELVAKIGGSATRFNNDRGQGAIFHPLASGVAELNKRLKSKFDPKNILNPGRMDNF